MAKLRGGPITAGDIIEFLETSSDFAFELQCLRTLLAMGFRCEHGGSYVDRVTNKPRQFDIRLYQDKDPYRRLRCSIECKNLSESFPLVIMCAPRATTESFHEVLISYHPDIEEKRGRYEMQEPFRRNCQAVRLEAAKTPYAAYAFVGKSSAQVGRSENNSITSNDSEVFDKWAQALASTHDLADEAADDGEKHETAFVTLLLPILVVPDGTLWKADYSPDGVRVDGPSQVDRCSFFIGREYFAGQHMRGTNLVISHMEFVTVSGLKELMRDIFDPAQAWFPIVEQRK